jgi:DNA primase catalytic subunit
MWKRFFTVFFLVLFFLWQQLFCLTPEEEAKLPSLSKEKLIQIIMIYDQQLTETEKISEEREADLKLREDNLLTRENSLSERETALTESESHIKLRENLLAESYRLQKEANRQNYNTGLIYGLGGGIILGGVGGYLLPHS